MSKYHTHDVTRLKIDDLLRQNARLESSMGTDSTKEEKKEIKAEQKVLMSKIKERDVEFWAVIVVADKR